MELICNRHVISEHRLSGNKWKCKKCEYVYSRKYMENLKIKAMKYGGGECKKCGYDKCWKALHFHHVDPINKEFNIFEGRPGFKKVRNWELLKKEIDKCILLCANCHSELHAKDERKEIIKEIKLNLSRIDIELYNKSIINNRKTSVQCLQDILKKPKVKKELKEDELTLEFIYMKFLMPKENNS